MTEAVQCGALLYKARVHFCAANAPSGVDQPVGSGHNSFVSLIPQLGLLGAFSASIEPLRESSAQNIAQWGILSPVSY